MADDGLPDVEVLDLFVIDDESGQIRVAEPWERPAPVTPSVAVGSSDDAAAAEADEAPPVPVPGPQASPMSVGPGSGQRPAVRPRPIGTHEIFHPVLVSPATAHDLLVDGGPLRGIERLEVDLDRCKVRGATMTWPVKVDTGWIGGRRAAELCVRPSPSWVLTVVELRPRRYGRVRSKRFLRTGIDIVEELCDRLLLENTRPR